jgi:hypothetical protein
MTSYHEPNSRVWSPVKVRGTAMEKSPVFEGNGTQSALFAWHPAFRYPTIINASMATVGHIPADRQHAIGVVAQWFGVGGRAFDIDRRRPQR